MPTASVDLILTDPPYNLSGYSTGNMQFPWRKTINNDLADWDKVTFDPSEWAEDFIRVLKPNGNIFAFTSYNLLGKWHEVFDPLFETFQFMVWHKTNPVPKIRKAGFLNSCELCARKRCQVASGKRERAETSFCHSPLIQAVRALAVKIAPSKFHCAPGSLRR